MNEKIRTIITVVIIALIIFAGGYFTGDRQRAIRAGLVNDQLRTELAAEKARNTELERIHIADGIELDKLGSELSAARQQLQRARDSIGRITDIDWRDASTIRGARTILDNLRTKIKEYQESLIDSGGPGIY